MRGTGRMEGRETMEAEERKRRKDLIREAKDACSLVEPIMGEEDADFVRETFEALIVEVQKLYASANGGE
jgi:hypothetical protein